MAGDELRGPWRPPGLRAHALDDDTLAALAYIVVDERVGPYYALAIEPWPSVDAWGRMRFPRRHEVGHVVLHVDVLRAELYEGLRDRAPRIGDVFAGTLASEAEEFVRSEEQFAWEHPLSDLVSGAVYDVTADARAAVKAAFYAASIPPLPRAAAEARGLIEQGDHVVTPAPVKSLSEGRS